MDLLTVLAHELGHVLGRGHTEVQHDVMESRLSPGVRTLPGERLEFSGHRLGVADQPTTISDHLFSSPPLSALDSPLSSIPHSDFRIPTSAGSPLFSSPRPWTLDPRPSTADALFARLEDHHLSPLESPVEDADNEEVSSDEADSGLDLWSLLIDGA